MDAFTLFLQSTGYALALIVAGVLFVLAVNDIADEESTSSRLTKTLEWVWALMFLGAVSGGIITGLILFFRWLVS